MEPINYLAAMPDLAASFRQSLLGGIQMGMQAPSPLDRQEQQQRIELAPQEMAIRQKNAETAAANAVLAQAHADKVKFEMERMRAIQEARKATYDEISTPNEDGSLKSQTQIQNALMRHVVQDPEGAAGFASLRNQPATAASLLGKQIFSSVLPAMANGDPKSVEKTFEEGIAAMKNSGMNQEADALQGTYDLWKKDPQKAISMGWGNYVLRYPDEAKKIQDIYPTLFGGLPKRTTNQEKDLTKATTELSQTEANVLGTSDTMDKLVKEFDALRKTTGFWDSAMRKGREFLNNSTTLDQFRKTLSSQAFGDTLADYAKKGLAVRNLAEFETLKNFKPQENADPYLFLEYMAKAQTVMGHANAEKRFNAQWLENNNTFGKARGNFEVAADGAEEPFEIKQGETFTTARDRYLKQEYAKLKQKQTDILSMFEPPEKAKQGKKNVLKGSGRMSPDAVRAEQRAQQREAQETLSPEALQSLLDKYPE